MLWELHGVNIKPSAALSDYAEQRIHQPMSELAPWVKRVELRLRDTDPNDLSAGRHVKAVVRLGNGATLVVDRETHDLYAGIDFVSDRLRRHVRKRLDKHRALKGHRGRVRRSAA